MDPRDETAMIQHVKYALQSAMMANSILREAQKQFGCIQYQKKEEAAACAQDGKTEMQNAKRILDAQLSCEPDCVFDELYHQYDEFMRAVRECLAVENNDDNLTYRYESLMRAAVGKYKVEAEPNR